MTDTGAGISVTVESLQENYNEILQIDQQLDAASGSEAAGRVALGNELAEQYKAVWTDTADQVKTFLKEVEEPEHLAGVYTGILTSIRDEFKKGIDTWMDEQVALRKADQPEIPEEEIKKLEVARKDLVERYKALAGILELFGQDISEVGKPKKRSGARGKRGPKILSNYDYYIDDKLRTPDQNTLSSVANTITGKLGWKVAELRTFLTDSGVNLEAPGAGFEVTLPTDPPKVLKAVRKAEVAEDAPAETEEEDEETPVLDEFGNPVEEDEDEDEDENGETE